MRPNKIIVATLLATSFLGCGESFQATFSGTANVDLNTCPNGGVGAYDIRVSAQVSGDMNLTVLEMRKAAAATSDGTDRYFVSDVKIAAPLNGDQFSASNLRIYQNSEVDAITASGAINTDRTEITGLQMTRTKETNGGGYCMVNLRASLLKRD